MTYWLRVGLMALATLCALGSATLLFRARNDRADVTGLPVFFLEPLFPAGRRLRKLLKRKDRSSRDRYRKLLELYAPGEADRIRRQAMDAGYTYLLLLVPLLLLMLAVGIMDITGAVVIAGLALLQVIVCFTSKTNALIHDLLAGTVVVDVASQMIFRDTQDLIDYKKKLSREQSNRQTY